MIMLLLCLLLSFGLLACSEPEPTIEPPAEPVLDISASVQKLQEQFDYKGSTGNNCEHCNAKTAARINGGVLVRYRFPHQCTYRKQSRK